MEVVEEHKEPEEHSTTFKALFDLQESAKRS